MLLFSCHRIRKIAKKNNKKIKNEKKFVGKQLFFRMN